MDLYSSTELYLLSMLGQRIINTYLHFKEQIPLHLLDSFVRRLADTFEMVAKYHDKPIQSNVIEEMLHTTSMIMRHCEDENAYHIMVIYRDYLQHFNCHEDFYLTTKHACLLIEALSLYHKDGDDGSRLATELMPYVISSGMSVIDLFDCLPSSVESLCNLISMFPHDIGIPYIPRLIDLVNQRSESISFGLYKSLHRISFEFSSNELFNALASNLN